MSLSLRVEGRPVRGGRRRRATDRCAARRAPVAAAAGPHDERFPACGVRGLLPARPGGDVLDRGVGGFLVLAAASGVGRAAPRAGRSVAGRCVEELTQQGGREPIASGRPRRRERSTLCPICGPDVDASGRRASRRMLLAYRALLAEGSRAPAISASPPLPASVPGRPAERRAIAWRRRRFDVHHQCGGKRRLRSDRFQASGDLTHGLALRTARDARRARRPLGNVN
jgi:hypothetical protein